MLSNKKSVTSSIGGRDLTIETGVLAKQSNGSVTVRCGDTVLLATAVMSKEPKEGQSFFPLMVEYSEKSYSAGKIPGGFFKREARPSTQATLAARLIDRPIRPLFPKNFFNDLQIIITVLSYDDSFPPEHFGIIAASAALSVSDIPFSGPVGSVCVGLVDGEFIINPTFEQLEKSEIEIIVAGTKDAILMVEAGCREVTEETVIKAINHGHTYIKQVVALQEELAGKVSPTKIEVGSTEDLSALENDIRGFIQDPISQNMKSGNKQQIETFLSELRETVLEKFTDAETENEAQVAKAFETVKKEAIRQIIIRDKIRPDGRQLDEIRAIETEVGLLPRTHGSALFTRGETQSLGVITLGTADDEQMIDGLLPTYRNNYFFHYNFPPFSVGETGFLRTGRRELGHGALAERALEPLLPKPEEFPYTVRIVSEILESNGSSSMASVCSGTLCLMDCGVPIKRPASGIAMGLLMDGNDYTILSDIQGLEDHYGDMDFKVAGTEKGITALQLDIKISGLSQEILEKSLEQAKKGRFHILDKMTENIKEPRKELSPNAPKITTFAIDPEKVGMVIGPGGKMIRQIEETSGAKVVIMEGNDGKISVAAPNTAAMDKARNMIEMLTKEIEEGEVYEGKVTKTTNFGAFVELVPGKEGLIHISKLSNRRLNTVEEVINTGDLVTVKVIEIDNLKRLSLAPVTKFD